MVLSKKVKICGIFSAVEILFGIVTIVAFPFLYDLILESQLIIKPGSTSFELWESLPIPMYMKLYYYNITNGDEIEARIPGVTPRMTELGPYVFSEGHQKVNITWNGENDTVSFQQVKTWHFMPDLSNGSLEDEITTVNIIALAAAEYARFNPDVFYTYAINGFFEETNATLFMTHSVNNMTFEGIYDSILQAAAETPAIHLPIPFDKFGWFYPRNNSAEYDGWFSMHTGAGDFSKVGQISEWNYSTTIREDIYTAQCGFLNGSAGEFFPSHQEQTFVDFFTPDLCRSIRFEFSEETEVIGVNAYKYTLGENLVANASTNPENWCFNFKPDAAQNVPNGMLNVSSCKFNAPAFISYPHFYKADPYYLNQFEEGMFQPDKSKHESHVTLEPVSGVPLDVKVRMQINALVSPVNTSSPDGSFYLSIKLFDGLDPIFYPMVWFETYTELDEETKSLMKFLGIAPKIGYILGGILISLGSLSTLFTIYRFMKDKQSTQTRKKVPL